jgi:hypothetical protein
MIDGGGGHSARRVGAGAVAIPSASERSPYHQRVSMERTASRLFALAWLAASQVSSACQGPAAAGSAIAADRRASHGGPSGG